MITIRKAEERGKTQLDWLKSLHSFSFGSYYDPKNMQFASLRVINEDYIQPNSGFPFHSHADMEILTYVISGELEHKDSLGNTSVISHGEIQLMRAGTGITHSEYNPSKTTETHMLQIWLIPDTKGLSPLYQQQNFAVKSQPNELVLIASPDGENSSFKIAQDIKIYAAIIENNVINYAVATDRKLWIQVISGDLDIKGNRVSAGDGVKVDNELMLSISGAGEFILFDLLS